jgi:hypothetical protein
MMRPFLKKKKPESKRVGGLAQVVELLPSKHQTLNSIPSTTKKKKKKNHPGSEDPFIYFPSSSCDFAFLL